MLRIDYSTEPPTYSKDGERLTEEMASDELARLGYPEYLVRKN